MALSRAVSLPTHARFRWLERQKRRQASQPYRVLVFVTQPAEYVGVWRPATCTACEQYRHARRRDAPYCYRPRLHVPCGSPRSVGQDAFSIPEQSSPARQSAASRTHGLSRTSGTARNERLPVHWEIPSKQPHAMAYVAACSRRAQRCASRGAHRRRSRGRRSGAMDPSRCEGCRQIALQCHACTWQSHESILRSTRRVCE